MSNPYSKDIQLKQSRILWLDWMKVIGMYFIIVGHLFPAGYTFLYVFNVPIFFLISGFVCKHEKSNAIFWRKIFFNYITPLFLIRTIMFFWEKYTFSNPNEFLSIFQYWLFMAKGYQNCLGACWFIYTLIIIRIIYQYLQTTKITILLFFVLTGIAIYFNLQNIHKCNAVLNVTIAFQPFTIGLILQKYKYKLILLQPTLINTIITLIIGISIIICCGLFNNNVWVYNNCYGNSFFIYLVGAFGGATMVFSLSKLVDRYFDKLITTLALGNIITLGLHQFFINLASMIFPPLPYLSYALALVFLLAFYPVIRFCQSWCPILLGLYHPSISNDQTK